VFVQNLPRWLRVILLSRREPPLPCERLRARGQLAEIQFAELRFTFDEASELMSKLAPGVPDERIATAAVHADGWAAGVQLAAVAARSERAQRSSPAVMQYDAVLVQDYVLHEVLASEAPDVVVALSDMAVARRVNISLARALSGRTDADQVLAHARSRGLCVFRLERDGWFEIHSLVRKALVADLTARAPDRLARQHATCARWFEQNGDPASALHHWLSTDEPREALRLLSAEQANMYYDGFEPSIKRTIAALAERSVVDDLDSMIEFASCHLFVDRPRFVELVEEASWAGHMETTDAAQDARLTILRAIAATLTGSWSEGCSQARETMRNLTSESWRDPITQFGWNTVARGIALSEQWDDRRDDVQEARLAVGAHPRGRLAFEGSRALGQALSGRPVDALRVAAGVRRAASVTTVRILRSELTLAEAVAHYEIGDRSRALGELSSLVETAAATVPYCTVLASAQLVQARLDEDDLDAAQACFAAAESQIEVDGLGPDSQDVIARVGVRLTLARGQIHTGRQLAQEMRDPFWGGISTARIHLAEGSTDDARSALGSVAPRCVRHEVVLGLLKAQAAADPDEARTLTANAVDQAVAAGLLQTVASEGADVVALVERAAWRAPQSWLDRLRRASGSSGSRPEPGNLIEPLTERERDVLRFLPSRLSTREIADELHVSINTLKFHLKVIYRKLGVGTRAEAAEAARRVLRTAYRNL
jgi:LuxR family maltose regulon positive regulatory protein